MDAGRLIEAGTSKSLSNYGVQLFSVNQPIEPLDPAEFNPYAADSESMMRGMNQIISRWQVADLRRKYRYGVKARVDRGLPSLKIPYGYTKPPGREQDPKAVPIQNPAQAAVVLDIRSQFLNGLSFNELQAYLTERYPTPSGIPTWSKQTIRKILSNPFYAGKVSFGQRLTVNDARNNLKKLVPNATPYTQQGAHVPLYSWDDYLSILSEFDRRAALPTVARYPWSGMLHCAECGHRLRRKAGRYSCLHCYKVVIHDEDIKRVVPPAIQAALRPLDPNDELPQPPAPVEAPLQDLEKQKQRVKQAYESGLYTLQEAEAKVKGIEAKIKTLRDTEAQQAKQNADLQAFYFTLEEAQQLLDDFPRWMLGDDPRIVNTLVLRLIRQVNITPEGQALPILRNKSEAPRE